jgi:hypothetical protein
VSLLDLIILPRCIDSLRLELQGLQFLHHGSRFEHRSVHDVLETDRAGRRDLRIPDDRRLPGVASQWASAISTGCAPARFSASSAAISLGVNPTSAAFDASASASARSSRRFAFSLRMRARAPRRSGGKIVGPKCALINAMPACQAGEAADGNSSWPAWAQTRDGSPRRPGAAVHRGTKLRSSIGLQMPRLSRDLAQKQLCI